MPTKGLSELGEQAQKQLRRRGLLHRMMPASLMGRMLVILVTPLLLVVVISLNVFLNRHFDAVSKRLARGIAGEVALMTELIEQPGLSQGDHVRLLVKGSENLGIEFSLRDGTGPLPPQDARDSVWSPVLSDRLEQELRARLDREWTVEMLAATDALPGRARITVVTEAGELIAIAPLRRLTSSSIPLFVAWLVASAAIFMGIAVIFLRNQMRPIRRLADAAEAFGRGEEQPGFRAQGAIEVRQAALAFLRMRDRLKRQMAQRTELLAGVSHDLRTPLTRMKLQLAMLPPGPEADDLASDIDEMELMIGGYLNFARGEDQEQAQDIDLTALLQERAAKHRVSLPQLHIELDSDLHLRGRPIALARCIDNLVGNAARHASAVWISARRTARHIEIVIDDNGPGIPAAQRDAMFRPFQRLEDDVEGDGDPVSSGAGLGLSIARDIARRHGGDIKLGDSDQGGLKATIRLPL